MKRAVIRIHLEAQPEGGYTVTSPDVRGLVTEGETIEEAVENAQEVARLLYESYLDLGWELPPVFRDAEVLPELDVTIAVGLG